MRMRLLPALALLMLAVLASWAIRHSKPEVSGRIALQYQPEGVMGTVCNLVVVTDREHADEAQRQLDSVEAELRRLEALLSTWIDSSQLSRFNAAPGGQSLDPAQDLVDVFALARDLHSASEGAFDITARPLIELWRRAEATGVPPSQEDLQVARAESHWDQIRLAVDGITKDLSSTRVDVDGIAKGYAIDRALEVLQESGAPGGMVDVGGDLRLFGESPEGEHWTVGIRSPFADRPWAEIELQEGAVCSSGDYARYLEIGGQRFSHIIDPRTGQPSKVTRAVTVVGPDAATADAWATALSILGARGLELLGDESKLHAMIVTGGPDDYEVSVTPGFRQLLVRAAFDLKE